MFKEVKFNKKRPAFTIVELLIVIVVIGILAAISIVSYNGIQDRARAVTIKSDLANAARQVAMYRIHTGSYPTNVELYDSDYHSLKSVFTNSAGSDPYHLLMYCTDGEDFVFAGRQEGVTPAKYYIVQSSGGVREADSSVPATASAITLCRELGFPDETQVYRPWIKSYSELNRGWSSYIVN